MIRHIWSIICQEIIVDRESNQISYINSLEEVATNKLPATFPVLKLGIFMGMDPLEVFRVRIRLRSPDGSITNLHETEDYKFHTKRNRINFVLGGIEFKIPGTHDFLVECKTDSTWEVLDEIPFEIKLLENLMISTKK